MRKIKIGDWVTSYSKGFYRVEKVVTRYYDELDIVDEENKKIGTSTSTNLLFQNDF